MLNPADLPDDIDTLKALLWAHEVEVVGLKAQLNSRAAEIEPLKLQIAKLRRMQFGRKSEKLDHQIEQLELQLEDLQADDAEAEREMPAVDQAPRKQAAPKPLPEHLPRDEQRYLPANEACPSCWRTCWWPSSRITCRYTGSRLSTHARVSSWTGPCWPAGSALPARCCARWSKPSVNTYWLAPNCMPMTRRYQ